MALSSVLAKNTTYLAISSIAQKAVAFVWFAYLSHQLGDDLLGKYIFAVNFTSIFVILMNFGFIPVLTRDGAKFPEQLQQQFNRVMSAKIVLTIISVIVLLGVFFGLNQISPRSEYTVMLVYLATAIIVFDTFRSIIFAVLRAKQQMQYEAIGQFFYQVVVVAAGVALLLFGFKAGGVIVAINIASILFLLYGVYILRSKTTVRFHWDWQWSALRKLLIVAAPFALADVFFKLNGSIDTVMLEYFKGDRFVAWYNVAVKLTVTLSVIPGMFATAFFPAMSQAVTKSREALRDIFEQTSIQLFIISAPLAVGAMVLAPTIIHSVFKQYPASIQPLQWMMVGVIFIFFNYPIGNTLNAANRQLLNTANMGIALGFNVILNLILIPPYSYIGAAIAAMATTIVLPLLGLPYVYQMTSFRWLVLLKRLGLALVASTGMGALVWWLQTILPETKMMFLVIAAAGAVSYGMLALLIRAITVGELKTVWRALRSRA